jgi:hypothetical protein
MTETVHPCIHGVTSKGKCECKEFVQAPSNQGIWPICGVCSHTAQTHGIVVSSIGAKALPKSTGVLVTVSEPVPAFIEPVAKTDAPVTVTVPSVASDGTLTPKVMRAWLVANKVPDVGVRGRLKPEHIAMATAALSK